MIIFLLSATGDSDDCNSYMQGNDHSDQIQPSTIVIVIIIYVISNISFIYIANYLTINTVT